MSKARECGSKQPHTKNEAKAHRWALVHAGAHPAALKVYRCKHCNHWHVGHKKRGRR